MKAAVVRDFDKPPVFGDFDEPPAPGDGHVLVSVQAAALSNLVKGQASGTHYSSPGSPPFVPGVDGVGRLSDGRRVYFAFPAAPFGAMAEHTVVSRRLLVEVPPGIDDVTAAGAANPGMSSWAALTERAHLVPGETVLINGATGVSGRLAIQIAKHLGARRVIATGRTAGSVEPLRALGADAVIALDRSAEALVAAFRQEMSDGVDVVLDYLWGSSAEHLMRAVGGDGAHPERRVRFVQIGSMSGETVALPAAALRSAGLELMGSGIGSVPKERLLDTVGSLLKALAGGSMRFEVEPVAISEVETAWNRPSARRVVFTW